MVKPCVKCAATDRDASGTCKPCTKERKRIFYLANKEKIRERNKKWKAENPEAYALAIKKWHKENPEKCRASVKKWSLENPEKYKQSYDKSNEKSKDYKNQWVKDNPDKVSAYLDKYAKNNPEKMAKKWKINQHNRRAKKIKNGGKLSLNIEKTLFNRQNGKCACCSMPLKDGWHLDHIMPLALGGRNEDRNMQLLLPKCNLIKNAKHPIDYMRQKGFLL